MVGTRSGLETSPYSKEQQEKMAALVQENRERKEREKQAKLKAIADEQAAKMKRLEEEMKRVQQEEGERRKAAEAEAAAEEEKERMRIESGEGSSGGTMKWETDTELEKKISEWVANLSLVEDEEAESYVTKDEKAALAAELAAMTDPMERREREDEKKLAWKLRMKREKKRRKEEVNKMTAAVAKVQECRAEVLAQPDDKAKWDKVLGYLEVLSKAWIEERQASWSQDVALSAMRSGFRDFAREIVTHIGGEVKQLRDNVGKFCEGAIQGAKASAAVEGEARPLVYLDDILVFSKTLQEHQGHLRQVLEKLREANFKINAKKCEWAKTQVLYLGHVLDGDGIKPEDSKIAAIRDWPTPRTLTELRSFLGLANYYRKFVRNFSTIAAPLRRMLKKEAIWQWDKDCTSALKKLKRALIEYPVLEVADPSLPFVVTTHASQYGIGAVLQQDDDNGYRPVEFMSARMPCEKVATSTYERELYALRQVLDHWKHYLLGRHFKVHSDHETLRWLKTQAKMTPKLTRWPAEIDQFDFELKPVKGKYNVVADALSRRSNYFGAVVHYLDIGRDLQEKVRQRRTGEDTGGQEAAEEERCTRRGGGGRGRRRGEMEGTTRRRDRGDDEEDERWRGREGGEGDEAVVQDTFKAPSTRFDTMGKKGKDNTTTGRRRDGGGKEEEEGEDVEEEDVEEEEGEEAAFPSPAQLPAMAGPFVPQFGVPLGGMSAAVAQTIASSSSGPAAAASRQQAVQSLTGPQHPRYLKTPMKPPTVFTEDKKDEALDTWLRTVPLWVRVKRTLHGEEVITAASYLEGSATRWLNGYIATNGFARLMNDWTHTKTLESFMEIVEARWHNPQQVQHDALTSLDTRKFKTARELTSSMEKLVVAPGVRYDPLLTMFLRCLPTDIKNLLVSEASIEYHTLESFSNKALDLRARLGGAQQVAGDGRKKKIPQEWKRKGSLMMVDSDGNQTDIDDLSQLVEDTEIGSEDSAEGSNFTAITKGKAVDRRKGGQQKSQGQAQNSNKAPAWVRTGLDHDVWRDQYL
ncbi:hypothetical protein CBR_g49484 [Chara braunii]|uniref:Reverse transcriptase/retrotransposon-derived protein RNase H-like domain-containing protein n=1 Tax=Chara braunii TaxID=69332 RepID=A0A388K504_CHABU|nr:hypothetical protein CBR_g49484 [Chara braunii]|eukprot:GBG65121.1 hypothetical protein CBR_g49484 [Chara braunii]